MQVMSTPRNLSIAVTGRCNLRCQYCFYANEMTALGDLPTETWLTFFDELGESNVIQVILTGGEIFTRRDIFDLIDGVIANRMRYTLLTNGTLITEETVQQLTVSKRLQRLDYVQVSIDGSNAETHNVSRPNSFDRAIRGLRMLVEAEIPSMVRVTLGRHNIHDFEAAVDLLLGDIGVPAMSLNETMPMGSSWKHQNELVLAWPEVLEAMHTVQKLEERYPGRISSSSGPQSRLKMYGAMEKAKQTGEKTAEWVMGSLSACGCVFSKLDVLHDGTYVPCHILSDVRLGNIQQDSLEEVWQRHETLEELRQRTNIAVVDIPSCARCEWNAVCNGSCPGLAHELTGDFNRPNPHYCYQQFLKGTGYHVISS